MKTYIAHIIYRIICSGVTTEQYEEQWRLILAEDHNAALRNAREVAGQEESMFVDRHGRTVNWQLVAIKDIQETDLAHGSLLTSLVNEVRPITDPLWVE
ncbi:MAG: DUF4288 domain-containing protein [Flavipsychrobacter sp.]|nr:DUF4288 domain-containing protein [Flavipsychrobacter sp.]